MSGISKNEQDLFERTETMLSQWQKLGIEFGIKLMFQYHLCFD